MEEIGFCLEETEERLVNCCAPLLDFVEGDAETSTFAQQLLEAETGSALSVGFSISDSTSGQVSPGGYCAENAVYDGEC